MASYVELVLDTTPPEPTFADPIRIDEDTINIPYVLDEGTATEAVVSGDPATITPTLLVGTHGVTESVTFPVVLRAIDDVGNVSITMVTLTMPSSYGRGYIVQGRVGRGVIAQQTIPTGGSGLGWKGRVEQGRVGRGIIEQGTLGASDQ